MKKKQLFKSNIEQAKYLAKESVLLYNDNSPLRLCVLGIPAFGQVIDTILTSKGQSISYNRLLEFFKELENEVSQIDERLINLEFVESEEFYDLLVKTIESSLKTRHVEKRKYFARILKNKSIIQENDLDPEFYLDILNELTIQELYVAKKLFELKTTGEFERIIKDKKNIRQDKDVLALTDLPIDKEDYTFILLRLQRVGLIKEQVGTIAGYTGGVYNITETFRKLIKIIEK